MKNHLSAPACGLCGGRQQRLCIARTPAVEPDVLLMDDPCSGLDPQSTLRIEEPSASSGAPHDRDGDPRRAAAARVSDFTALFTIESEGEPGRLIEHGATDRVFSRPGKPRTEAYVSGRFG